MPWKEATSMGAAGEMFSRWEWRRLSGLIGNVGLTQQTQVPDGLFTPPTLKELLGNNPVPPGAVANRRLAGKELFSVWSQQAEARGFGPREVQKVFEAAHRLGRIVRSHYNGLSAEGALAAWDALNRTGVKQGVSLQTVKSLDRGPSL